MDGYKLRGRCGFVGLGLGFLVGRFFGWFFFAAGILLSFFPFSGSFLYTPCVLLETLFSFVQYTAFIDQNIYIYILHTK